jgi:inorganic pyrophosphatase
VLVASEEHVSVVVEIPKGSRNKYEIDRATGRIRLDRMLFSSVHYPADYGYIEGTLGGDGDELDALVLVGEATFPGCLVEARPVGAFVMSDDKGPDEKILTVPVSDPNWGGFQHLSDVPPHLLREIEHFFQIYKELEGKPVEIKGWEDERSALAIIWEATARAEAAR